MRKIVALLFGLFLIVSPVSGQIPTTPTYSSGGLNVGVYDANDHFHLVVEPFSVWGWDSIAGGFNGQMMAMNMTLYPDLRTIGCNGMDQNPNGAGRMPPDGNDDIFVLGNPTTGDICIIVTMGDGSFGGIANKPPGYTLWAKLRYGVLINEGALVDNHTANWPMPNVRVTPDMVVTRFFGNQSQGLIDLSKLIPENSRFAAVRLVITNGTANVSIGPGPCCMKLAAYNQTGVVWVPGIRVQHGSLFADIQAASNVEIDVHYDGWDQTEAAQ